MHLLCPHCQQPITVPDTAAGQTVECPLCGKPFPAPATSLYAPQAAAGAASPPPRQDDADDREPYGVVTPVAPNRAAHSKPEQPRIEPPASPRSEAPPAPPPPAPPSTDSRQANVVITLYLPVVRVITAVALLLALVLTFFPWSGSYPAGNGVYTQSAWQAMFGIFSTDQVGNKVYQLEDRLKETVRANLLLLPFLLLLLVVCVLVALEFAIPHFNRPLPPRIQRFRPESYELRHGIQVGLIALATVLLLGQVWFGYFGVERALAADVEANPELVQLRTNAKTPDEIRQVEIKQAEMLGRFVLERRIWLRLAIFAQLVALLGLAAEFWLVRRGQRPEPRLELVW